MASVGRVGTRQEQTIKSNVAFVYGRKSEEAAHDLDKRKYVKSNKFIDKNQISNFSGEYQFLSPIYPCMVEYNGEKFPSYQHALEASKLWPLNSTSDNNILAEIKIAENIKDVKKIIKHIDTTTWKEKCVQIAEDLIRDKFLLNKSIRNELMKTIPRNILYRNDYGDSFWGVSGESDKGQNKLGLILERIRGEIERGDDLEMWITSKFKLMEKDKINIQVHVMKDGLVVQEEIQYFEHKNVIYIGKAYDLNDIVAAHPSISRCHCILVIDAQKGALLLDLNSSNHTYINGVILAPYEPVAILSTSKITLGASSREYTFTLNTGVAEQRKLALYEKMADPNILAVDSKEVTVYIGNISYEATERDVRLFFANCGAIKDLKLPLEMHAREEGQKRRHQGYAFVVFEAIGGLHAALRMDGDEFLGRTIRVKRSTDTTSSRPATLARINVVDVDISNNRDARKRGREQDM